MYHEEVDFTAPLEAVFPGATSSVLAVLARAERPLTLRQTADRAGVSHPQVARHIERLEALGVVQREVVGRSHQVRLNNGAVGQLIRRFVDLDRDVLDRMRDTARHLEPNAVSIVVFGSFARGAADASSDIDVAIVADDPESDEWLDRLSAWIDEISEFAGSPVAEIVISTDELLERTDHPLWTAIRSDGLTIAGRSLTELATATAAG